MAMYGRDEIYVWTIPWVIYSLLTPDDWTFWQHDQRPRGWDAAGQLRPIEDDGCCYARCSAPILWRPWRLSCGVCATPQADGTWRCAAHRGV